MAYSYKCSISFGLIYIPVTLHASVKTQDVGFNMLDKKTMSRVKYKKTCEECDGREVKQEDIVKGYEYEDDKYVVFTEEDCARYCHHSPTIEEGVLHEAIMDAIQQVAMEDADVLKVLKEHIAMGIGAENKEEITVELELRVAQIDAEFKAMIDSVSADTIDGVDEARMQQLLIEKNKLMEKLNQIAMSKEQDKKAGERMNTIFKDLTDSN